MPEFTEGGGSLNEKNTVLLVEDDHALLDLNRRVLEREGYRVLPARNLKEAREAMGRVCPQAVVLDVELPDGSGIDFCRELRRTGGIPIMFLTSLKGDKYEKAGYDAGADDYIVKPYRIERLTESVAALTTGGRRAPHPHKPHSD